MVHKRHSVTVYVSVRDACCQSVWTESSSFFVSFIKESVTKWRPTCRVLVTVTFAFTSCRGCFRFVNFSCDFKSGPLVLNWFWVCSVLQSNDITSGSIWDHSFSSLLVNNLFNPKHTWTDFPGVYEYLSPKGNYFTAWC